MRLFCLLWLPAFYFFWKAIHGAQTAPEAGASGNATSGGLIAFALGSVVALFCFIFPPSPVPAGAFGFSRWLAICLNDIALPILLAVIAYGILVLLRVISPAADFGAFVLLMLMPQMAVKVIRLQPEYEAVSLVLCPLLLSALSAAVPLCIGLLRRFSVVRLLAAIAGLLALPLLAATAYWALFSQDYPLGYLLTILTVLPALLTIGLGVYRTEKTLLSKKQAAEPLA
jgi:hypothetical protein